MTYIVFLLRVLAAATAAMALIVIAKALAAGTSRVLRRLLGRQPKTAQTVRLYHTVGVAHEPLALGDSEPGSFQPFFVAGRSTKRRKTILCVDTSVSSGVASGYKRTLEFSPV